MFDIDKSILLKTAMSCKVANDIEGAKQFLKVAARHNFQIEVLDEVAYLQSEIKDYKECIVTLKKCLASARSPQQNYAIRSNLAKVYNHMNEPKLSLGYSNANYQINQGEDYDTQMEIAFSHYLMGDYNTSESMMRKLSCINDLPDNVRGRVLYNLGSYDIERGEFKKGLRGFIGVGHDIGIWKHSEVPGIPMWNGSVQSVKTLLVHSEGGIGDEIICVRFLKEVKQLGMNPVWIIGNKQLKEVFERNGFECTTDPSKYSPESTVQCMAMFLPILLNLDKTDLWTGPYLKASEEYVEKWKKILPEGKKLLCKWSGNPHYEQDLHRSLSIDFIKNLEYEGTKINIQMEPELDQSDMFNCRENVKSIEDTLAIIELCDDVVTSCTSIAHMVGAMDKNGIVCPPIASYYVWLGMSGVKSDWYSDKLKVFRQTQHRDWSLVFDKVQKELRESNVRK
jgi:hypothetical protein